MSDFSFSDGLFIPKGTNFVVAGRGINQDEVNFIQNFSELWTVLKDLPAVLRQPARIPRVPFC